MFSLEGKKALIVGIANDQSIAWGIARALKMQGASVAITYLNAKAEKYVRPLAEKIDAEIIAPLDITEDSQLDDLFTQIRSTWGRLDIVVHSIAFCPKEDLMGRVVDCSRTGFGTAMDISVHSFIRLVHAAEPLMTDGGTCMTMSFHGAHKVVDNYNVMGAAKAALETATKYMADELGPKGISVHALSPGPLATRAGSGIAHFDALMDDAVARAPTHKLVTLEDIGAYAVFLSSSEAARVTGGIHYIDGGYNITA